MARRLNSPEAIEESVYRCGTVCEQIKKLQGKLSKEADSPYDGEQGLQNRLNSFVAELDRRRAELAAANVDPDELIKLALDERAARNADYFSTGEKQPRRFTVLKHLVSA